MKVTNTLIVLNLIIFILSEYVLSTNLVMSYFGLNYLFFSGFYWQVFTTMFLHASFLHVAMNMAVLYQFGCILERYFGSLKFGFIYIIGGVITSVLSLAYTYYMARHGVVVNLVGASGAISVLLGVLANLDKNMRNGLIMAILVISFVPMLVGIKVGWYAHLFGFGIGYLYAKISLKR
ncbi:MAG: rhomboid family intramembrane serine protease [Campylobacter ureolyticus]|uniref:rhomboid family intramembrane serine protease n=1 Tax=Campylobacter ureolyticus TaxID=827 RepID=UPI0022B360C7|nr:rhomboid family intramembrane serine protease [Campylobacter ureolyticus]MCZ6103898.1 rhomboid family intramembrane serine protease [Campylobacter ureolyticus]MDU4981740.1 rhomboid family intramembrane serine protease [Campylobacter ureolyticus]